MDDPKSFFTEFAASFTSNNPADENATMALVSVARDKFSLGGFSKEQIDRIETQDKATGRMALYSHALVRMDKTSPMKSSKKCFRSIGCPFAKPSMEAG